MARGRGGEGASSLECLSLGARDSLVSSHQNGHRDLPYESKFPKKHERQSLGFTFLSIYHGKGSDLKIRMQ